MVGRAFIPCLLTTFTSFSLHDPGRDAQVDTCLIDCESSLHSFGLSSMLNLCLKSFGTLIAKISLFFIFLVRLFCAAVTTLQQFQSHKCRFTRKHGRWKNRSIFPSFFLVLSAVCLSHQQTLAFTSKGLHRAPCLAYRPSFVSAPRPRRRPFRDWVPFFNGSFALSTSTANFCEPGLLDLVCDKCQVSSVQDELPAKLLSAQGSFMALSWMDHMSRQGHTVAFDEPRESPSMDDLLTFKSSPTFKISTPLEDLHDDVVSALLELPIKPAVLAPTVSTDHRHIVDQSHSLRASSTKKSKSFTTDPEKIFQVPIDSGCSVSCSGFKEDFHGQLAMGDFGVVSTANGNAKIEGFGILRWDTLSLSGE